MTSTTLKASASEAMAAQQVCSPRRALVPRTIPVEVDRAVAVLSGQCTISHVREHWRGQAHVEAAIVYVVRLANSAV